MSGIGFPINVDVSSINAASTAVSNMGTKIEQEAKKANAEFQRMRKQIELATKDFDNVATSANKVWAGMGNNRNLNKAFERETKRVKELEKGITSLEKAYKAAYEKADTFNANLFKGIKAAELQYVKMTAMAQAVNDVAIATQKAIAKNKVLQSDEAKELARLEGLIAARKRYNKAKAGITDSESISLEVQAKRMELVRDATVKLATAEAKLTAETALLEGRMRQLGTVAGKSNLILKEQVKGVEEQTIYLARLKNTLIQLKQEEASLTSGRARAVAVQKEINKGLEQQAVAGVKLTVETALLRDRQQQLNTITGKSNLILKEQVKGVEQQITYLARLKNTLTQLKQEESSLASGRARNVAIQKEINKGLEQQATYTHKLANEKALLSIKTDQSVAAERQSVTSLKALYEFQEKLAKTTAELAIAKGALTAQDWKSIQQNSQKIAGLKEEATFLDRMKNKYAELDRSIKYLQTTQGQQLRNLTTQEQLQKRLNDLLARSTTENRKLLTQIAALEAEERKLMGTTKGLSTSFGALQQVAAATRATLSGLGAAFGSYTSATLLVSLATFGLVRNIRETVKVGAEFEDQITRVAAISNKASVNSDEYGNALYALKARAIEVASSSRFMATEVVQAMNELAMAGMTTKEILTSIRDVMNLAMIGAIGFGESSDIATNIMMGFQLNVEELTDVVDKMALAVTSSNQNISQLGNAMSYAAPVAAAFGINMDAIVAATEVLANSGIKASRAGTTLRRVIVSMFTPTRKGAEAMRVMGIETTKLGEEFEDLEMLDGPIGKVFNSATDGTELFMKSLEKFYLATAGATKNLGLLRDVVDIRALPGMIQLIKSMDDGTRSLESLKAALSGAGGTAEEMMGKMAQTLKNDWLVAKGAFESIQQSIYDLEKSTLGDFVTKIVSELQLLARNKDALKAMVDGAKEFAAKLWEVLEIVLVLKAAMLAFSAIRVFVGISSALTALTAGMIGATAATHAATAAQLQFATAGAAVTATMTATAAAGAFMGGALASAFGASSTAALMFGRTLSVLGGAIGLVTGAALALVRALWLPAAIGTAVYLIIDHFFDLGDAIEGATGKLTEHKEVMDQLEAKYQFLTDGNGLKSLYESQATAEQKVLDLSERSVINHRAVADELKRAREELTEINKQINTAHEDIKIYGQAVLGRRISEQKSALSEQKKILEDLESTYSRFQDKLNTAESWSKGNLTRAMQGPKDEYEAQIAKVRQLEAAIESLELQQAIALGTSKEYVKALGFDDTTLRGRLDEWSKKVTEANKQLDALYSERAQLQISGSSEDLLDKADERLSKQRELVAQLLMEEKAYRDIYSLFQQFIKLSDSSNPIKLSTAQENLDVLKASFNETLLSIGRTKDELEAVNLGTIIIQAENLEKKVASGLSTLTAMIENAAKIESPEALNAYMQRFKEVYAEVTGYVDAHAKKLENFTAIEDLAAKYDEASKSAYELFAAAQELSVLHVGKDWDLDKVNLALREQLGTVLKIDEQTGKLTDTSFRAVAQLREKITNEITRIQGAISELIKGGTTAEEVTWIQNYAGRLDSLTAAHQTLNGDLASFVIQQMQVKENTKDVNELYSDQAEILKLLGANTAALALQRKAETKEVTGLAKTLKDFKFLLEDINELQDRLTETADFTSKMDDAYADMDADMISKFGTGMAEWYNPTDAIGKIDSLKSSLRESMGATTELGQTAAQTFDDLFTALEARLRTIVAEAKSGMTALSEQMSVASGSPKLPASAQEFVTMMMPYATEAASRLGQDVYTILAQSAFETGYGKHLPRNADGSSSNNYFGIKAGKSWTGPVAVNATLEDVGGSMRSESAAFRSYSSPADSYNDYARMISGGRHSSAVNAGSPQEYFQSLKNSGYATDSNYVSKLMAVYNKLTGASAQVASNTKTVSDNTKVVSDETAKVADTTKQVSDGSSELAKNTKATTTSVNEHGYSLSDIEARMIEINKLQLERDNLWTELETAYKSATSDNNLTADETAELTAIHSRFSLVVDELNNKRQRAQTLDEKELVNQKKLQAEYIYNTEELQAMAGSYGSITTALSNYQIEYNKIIQLMQAGYLTQDQAFDLLEEKALAVLATKGDWEAYWAELKGGLQDFDELAIDVFDDFRDIIVDALVTGEADFDGFVESIKRKLAEIAVNTIVVNIIGNVLGVNSQLQGMMGQVTGGTVTGTAQQSPFSLDNLSSLLSKGKSLVGGNSLGNMFANSASKWLGTGTGEGWVGLAGQESLATAMAAPNWAYGLGGIASGYLGTMAADYMFRGENVGTGSQIGAAAGSYLGGTMAAGSAGWMGALGVAGGPIGVAIGALLGAVAGGGIGELFSDRSPDTEWFRLLSNTTGVGADATRPQLASAQTPFGTLAISGEEDFAGNEVEKAKSIVDTLSQIDTLLASVMTADQITQSAERMKYVEHSRNFGESGGTVEQAVEQMVSRRVFDIAAIVAQQYQMDLAEITGSLVGLTGSQIAEKLANAIQVINTVATQIFDTEVGKLLNMGVGKEFDSVANSTRAMIQWMNEFGYAAQGMQVFVGSLLQTVGFLNTSLLLTNDSFDDVADTLEAFGLTGRALVVMAERLKNAVAAAGMTMDQFGALQAAYYEAAYTEAERATHQANAARKAIADWNAATGNSLQTLADLRGWVEMLDENSEHYAGALTSAMQASTAFIALDQALQTLTNGAETTADEILEANRDAALERANEVYDVIVEKAKERSDSYIDELTAMSEAYITSIETEHTTKVDNLNEQIDLLNEWSSILKSAETSMESLRRQAESPVIDATRARMLEKAKSAVSEYKDTGKFPSDIDNVISSLGTVDPNDFATRDDWQNAINENASVISELMQLSGLSSSDVSDETKALQEQIEQENDIYEQMKKDEEARLDTLIKDEESRLQRELSALEEQFNLVEDAIGKASQDQLDTLYSQTDWLENIFYAITDVFSPYNEERPVEEALLETNSRASEFDESFYLSQNADVAAAINAGEFSSGLDHYNKFGESEGRMPNSYFDPEDYLTLNTDVAAAVNSGITSAFEHYQEYGMLENRNITSDVLRSAASVFDEDYYLSQYADVAEAVRNMNIPSAWSHYVTSGESEGRRPNEWFDPSDYLETYTDVADALGRSIRTALEHYQQFGLGENRLYDPIPGFASGGIHTGGIRVVGERGPEIEYTGPSYISPSTSLPEIMAKSNSETVEELKRLRQDLAESKRVQMEQARLLAEISKLHSRWNGEGLPPDRMDYQKKVADAVELP